jgi:hypothetical protein
MMYDAHVAMASGHDEIGTPAIIAEEDKNKNKNVVVHDSPDGEEWVLARKATHTLLLSSSRVSHRNRPGTLKTTRAS